MQHNYQTSFQWKKRSKRRKHCALAVVGGAKKFRPAADPFPGAQDGQNLISWRWSLPSPTDPVWWRSMHAISSYHGNTPTHQMCTSDVSSRQRSPCCNSQLSSADRATTPSQQVFVVERCPSRVRSSGYLLPEFLRDPTLSIDSLISALITRLFTVQRDM